MAATQLEKAVDCAAPVAQSFGEFLPAQLASTDNLMQLNTLARQIRGDGATEELIAMENADFTHVAWIEAHSHVFTDIGSQGGRQIAQSLEVNAIASHLARAD